MSRSYSVTWVVDEVSRTIRLDPENFSRNMTVDDIRSQILDDIQVDFQERVAPIHSDTQVQMVAEQIHEALGVLDDNQQ